MVKNAFRHFCQRPLGFAGHCLDIKITLLWKTFKALSHRKKSCLCLEFHWTPLLVWRRSRLPVWIANFHITVGNSLAEATRLRLHASAWLMGQFSSCGFCWHVSLVTQNQPGGKLLLLPQETSCRGSTPNRPARPYSDTPSKASGQIPG